jgi:hypothetical protein
MRLFEDLKGKVIPSPEAKLIPEFQALIKRGKKGNELLEIAFMYFMYDYRSPYAIYSPEHREQHLRTTLGLEKFKEDEVFKKAKALYLDMIQTPTSKALVATKKGLDQTHSLVDALTEEIRASVQRFQDIDGEDEEEDERRQKQINRAVSNLGKIMDITEKLVKAIGTVEQLQERIQKEQAGGGQIMGGGQAGDYED